MFRPKFLIIGYIRDPKPSPYRSQDRLDRQMQNYKIGPFEMKLPYISDIEKGLLMFSMYNIKITLKSSGVPYYYRQHIVQLHVPWKQKRDAIAKA